METRRDSRPPGGSLFRPRLGGAASDAGHHRPRVTTRPLASGVVADVRTLDVFYGTIEMAILKLDGSVNLNEAARRFLGHDNGRVLWRGD